MAISARSRRGTSVSFWRNHNAIQTMMAQACMPALRPVPRVKHEFILPPTSPIRSTSGSAPKVFIARA
ncbi:hypothetical protein EDE15_4190 [Edaphobacter aggregans]|uniref:Uncharacterized protein n=1 Tax=Edaphobacter aggregans TaxID=570835 RepID=A0A3R9NWQ7_9BACT|nr:hypothetical protein EDE15_4190 [Edaphobacter aggregans]